MEPVVFGLEELNQAMLERHAEELTLMQLHHDEVMAGLSDIYTGFMALSIILVLFVLYQILRNILKVRI